MKGDENLLVVGRDGTMRMVSPNPQEFSQLSVSPDGRQVVVRRIAGNDDLWTYDLATATPRRLTSEPGDEHLPLWTPDGKRIAFGWQVGGTSAIYWAAADGTGKAEELSRDKNKNSRYPGSFSPDGKTLAFVEQHPTQLRDIWTLSMEGERKAQTFPGLATNADEWDPRFSSDGNWLAYVSNESGRNEVYVRPAGGAGARNPISTEGGTAPVWARKVTELFFFNGKKLMSALLDAQSGSRLKVTLLMELKVEPAAFDVVDGEHFLMSLPSEHSSPTHYNLIFNWFEELRRLAPAR